MFLKKSVFILDFDLANPFNQRPKKLVNIAEIEFIFFKS